MENENKLRFRNSKRVQRPDHSERQWVPSPSLSVRDSLTISPNHLLPVARAGHLQPASSPMGQYPSTSSSSVELNRRDTPPSEGLGLGWDHGLDLPSIPPESSAVPDLGRADDDAGGGVDFTSELPDECLAHVFHFLGSGDRKRCSLVCRRWLRVDGESRHRLSLDAQADLLNFIPPIFARYDSISKLSLRCDRKSISINDDALILIALRCTSLSRLKLRGCRELTDLGIAAFSQHAKNLRKFSCGDWDSILQTIGSSTPSLIEVHFERIQLSDAGLAGISHCKGIEILHIVKIPECSNLGLCSIAENCTQLRKFYIDGWRINRIGDEGLVAIAKQCPNLQELVLIGVNATHSSLSLIASNCPKLERLALCGSDAIRDAEIACIATKCEALRKLCIKGCPITDVGIESLALGCPNLVKIKVRKCRGVSIQVAEWLRERKGSLIFNLDAETEDEIGVQESAVEFAPMFAQQAAAPDVPSSSNDRSTMFRAKLGLFAGRNFVACTFRRWSNGENSSGGNL
ncbi:hypothetical protein CRG98_027980 [Punica granatum]|uniref:F-box domain-containing protein n=1 Tax=Punica granatum TaxID=22663 RepID=A0A2I0J5X6_PUNGR|nr:hypothetical protein CRG98_027980 [Punica granatum]